jgi:hypothetical protein
VPSLCGNALNSTDATPHLQDAFTGEPPTTVEVPVRSVPVRFSPVRYLRFRSRFLMASRAVTDRIDLILEPAVLPSRNGRDPPCCHDADSAAGSGACGIVGDRIAGGDVGCFRCFAVGVWVHRCRYLNPMIFAENNFRFWK